MLGTDGLWDNVYDADILEILQGGASPTEMVERLAKLAVRMGEKLTGNSPFSDRGLQHGLNYPGGKMDDVTVIIARVVGA